MGAIVSTFPLLFTRDGTIPKKALEMNGLKDVPERGESC